MDARQLWLEALLPNVVGALPPPPAVVVEIGCGRQGGFVPALSQDGYRAVGIDPAAPDGDSYRRSEFERTDLPPEIDAIVACTSLHHVAVPAAVVDRMADNLAPEGVVVVVEWDWESFDGATAEWCFARLGPDDEPAESHGGWLQHQHRHWLESQEPWERYVQSWADRESIHGGAALIDELDRRFERESYARGAYFFPDLADTSEADELRAIGEGQIQATRIDYVGRRTSESARHSRSGV
ncbi:MAG: methyltransferase domain-containing protein [Solirubrobacterales bacterium]|nr:methyltransferase domain-containing protein [Solirubrobacterales bacterium]